MNDELIEEARRELRYPLDQWDNPVDLVDRLANALSDSAARITELEAERVDPAGVRGAEYWENEYRTAQDVIAELRAERDGYAAVIATARDRLNDLRARVGLPPSEAILAQNALATVDTSVVVQAIRDKAFDPQEHYVTRHSVWDDASTNRVWVTCRCGWDSGLLSDGNMPTTHRAEVEHYVTAAIRSQQGGGNRG